MYETFCMRSFDFFFLFFLFFLAQGITNSNKALEKASKSSCWDLQYEWLREYTQCSMSKWEFTEIKIMPKHHLLSFYFLKCADITGTTASCSRLAPAHVHPARLNKPGMSIVYSRWLRLMVIARIRSLCQLFWANSYELDSSKPWQLFSQRYLKDPSRPFSWLFFFFTH